MKVFLTAFGTRYVALLSACLESLRETNPGIDTTVYIDDLSIADEEILRCSFPDVQFQRRTALGAEDSSFAVRVSSKVDEWMAFVETCEDGDEVVLLDADTLTRGPVASEIPAGFDLVYTFKQEKWPLNNGVLFIRVSQATRWLLQALRQRTIEILGDTGLREVAATAAGAADQFALLELLGRDPTTGPLTLDGAPISVPTSRGTVRCIGVPCAVLNQTNSVPVSDPAVILHYKANMRNVIENDAGYTPARPRETSEDMVAMWEQQYRRHNDRALRAVALSAVDDADEAMRDQIAGEQHERRGLLNSEVFLLAALVRRLGVTTIVESGRARAQSTYLLGKYLPDVTIHSVEASRDEDAIFGMARVAELANVMLHEGSSEAVLPDLLDCMREQSVAVLIDGPKGLAAVKLGQSLVASFPQVALLAIHDMHANDTTQRGLPNLAPIQFRYAFDRVIFSDEPELVAAIRSIDDATGHAAGRKGAWELGSYGPTLGVAFPTWRDGHRARRRTRSRWTLIARRSIPRPARVLIRRLAPTASRVVARLSTALRQVRP